LVFLYAACEYVDDVDVSSISAANKPVYHLLQLSESSGTPCQENHRTWVFMFLHSCKDAARPS